MTIAEILTNLQRDGFIEVIDLETLREAYGDNELDHDRNPTEAGFQESLTRHIEAGNA